MSDLRLPPVANLSAALARLRTQKLLMRPDSTTWALTPLGESQLAKDAVVVPSDQLAAHLASFNGSELGRQQHTLIPPILAPVGLASGLARMLDQHPFEQNVMLITRFPKNNNGHFAMLIDKLALPEMECS